MHDVLVDESFLSPQDCTALSDQLRAAATASEEVFGRLHRTEMAAWLAVDDGAPELRAQLEDIRERARRALAGRYATDDTLHVEFTLFSEMRVGDLHPLHADAERPDGSGGWEPNHTAWRHSVALLYLNTAGVDFEGGALILPELDLTLPPRAGRLVGFPATRGYLHEVTPITRGFRCSLAIWTTLDSEYCEPWGY